MISNAEDNRIATLVHWSPGTDPERVKRWLAKLQEEGHVQSSYTGDYNPNYGEPVWYIP